MLTDEQIKTVVDYVSKNPATFYADYRDELPESLINTLIEKGRDSFWEDASEVEANLYDNWIQYSYPDYESEIFTLLNLEKDDDLSADIFEIVQENINYETKDYWRDVCRNTRFNAVLVPVNLDTGEWFDAVHWENGFSENLARAKALNKFFGIRDYKKIESCYSHESLKICGRLDLWDIIENGLPEKWIISPSDSKNAIFHTSCNGSGCLGSIKITKTVSIACDLKNDSANKYGVDAVYGFTGRFWAEELTPEREQKAA